MLQALPMLFSLLQGQQQSKEADKQNRVRAIMGEAPVAQSNKGGGLLQAAGGLLGGLGKGGGGAEDYAGGAGKVLTGDKRYDDYSGGAGGLHTGTNNMLDDLGFDGKSEDDLDSYL